MTIVTYFYEGKRLTGLNCGYIPKVGEYIKVKMRAWENYKFLKVSYIEFIIQSEEYYTIEVKLI